MGGIMPSSATITSTDLVTFVANTRAKASEVNGNFDLWRGHIIPIKTDTSAADDSSFDLGSDEHRWRSLYTNTVDLETSTNTATLVISGKSAVTAGAFSFQIEGTEMGILSKESVIFNISSTAAATTASLVFTTGACAYGS